MMAGALSSISPTFIHRLNFMHAQQYVELELPCFPYSRGISLSYSRTLPNVKSFHDHSEFKHHLLYLPARGCKSFPGPLEEFSWKKAEERLMDNFATLGQATLKWGMIIFLCFSFLSDVFLSISRNMELMIALGLFIGCAMADFLKEVSHEFHGNRQGGSFLWYHVGIGFFFLLIKFTSVNLSDRGRALLSHISNGGLMHVFWSANKFLARNISQTHGQCPPQML